MKNKDFIKIIELEIKEHRGNAYRDIKNCEICRILDKMKKEVERDNQKKWQF